MNAAEIRAECERFAQAHGLEFMWTSFGTLVLGGLIHGEGYVTTLKVGLLDDGGEAVRAWLAKTAEQIARKQTRGKPVRDTES